MYLHQLRPYEGLDLIVSNERTGHTVVLTPQGAVFDNEFTDDLTNLSIAFGVLFEDGWRIATTDEVKKMRTHRDDRMLRLVWASISDKPTHLKAV